MYITDKLICQSLSHITEKLSLNLIQLNPLHLGKGILCR